MPRLARVLPEYPDIKVELTMDYGLTDIVVQRYDIGIRLGDQVTKDMIAVRIGPDLRMAVVGAPAYLAQQGTPQELAVHNCINLRLSTHGGVCAWELQEAGKELQVRVEGQLTFNSAYQMLDAALDGLGLAYVPEDLAQPHVDAGRLQGVLRDWWPTFPGHHLYYPHRRQSSRALAVVVDALRYAD